MVNEDNSAKPVPMRYSIEASPSEYLKIKKGEQMSISYSMTDHLPAEPKTFKDLLDNRANYLRDININDTIIFECDPKRIRSQPFYLIDQLMGELEAKVSSITEDKNNHTKIINFKLTS